MSAPAFGGPFDQRLDKGTFVHCVYFWLKEGLTAEEQTLFKDGLESLIGIETVVNGYYGRPATTDRPIIDRTYSYALVCVFKDKEGHDAYQVDPVHDVFREKAHLWDEVKIYDFVVG